MNLQTKKGAEWVHFLNLKLGIAWDLMTLEGRENPQEMPPGEQDKRTQKKEAPERKNTSNVEHKNRNKQITEAKPG